MHRLKRLVIALLAALLLWPAGARADGERRPPAVGDIISAVRFPLSRYHLGVALAGSRVGANAFLLDIARMAGARCAINGTFFAAYPGETGEPYGTLVINGKLLHIGAAGTRLDVFADGTMRLAPDRLELRGALDGSERYPHNWYAYNLNQSPPPAGSGAYIYTPERGLTLGFRAEMAVVARGGRVIGITRGKDVAIPSDGFVLALQGKEVEVLIQTY